MTWYRRLARRLAAVLRRRRSEQEMDTELRLHLEMQIEDNLRAGITLEEARYAALRGFGGLARMKDQCRQQRGLPLLETLLQDARYGLRILVRQPALTSVVALTLGLGIGANTAIFSIVNAVLLRPLPLPEPERLVLIWENDRLRKTERESASLPDFLDIRAQARLLDSLAAYQRVNRTLTGESEPERLDAARVTAAYLDVLGVRPVIGRGFTDDELAPGYRRTVLLGYGLWQRRFAGSTSVLGRSVILDGEPHTIIGVIPAVATSALAPFQAEELWVPFQPRPDEQFRGRHTLRVYGRLKPGVGIEAAQAEMSGIMARLEQAYPDDNKGRGAVVLSLQEQLVGRSRRGLEVLLGAVGLLLLIGCVNVANLLLARLAAREREIAVRAALGAGRGRVVRQLLTESALLAAAGAGLGLLLAHWGLRAFVRLAPATIPRLQDARLDATVLAFTLATSAGAALLFGLIPALTVSRAGLHDFMKGGARGVTETAGSRRLRQALVIAEVALAVVLLAGTGMLLRSLWNLRNTNPGYEPAGALQASLELPASRYPLPKRWPIHDWPEVMTLADRIGERVGALPGVESASISLHNPLLGGWTTRVTVVGRPVPPPGEQEEAEFSPVDPEYFRTLRLPLLRGRAFIALDDSRHPLVAIVNEAFVRRHFAGEEPLGRQIRVYGPPREIVGIAGDMRYAGLALEPRPVMYLPFRQNPLSSFSVIVRSRQEPLALAPAVRREILALDRELALFDVTALDAGLAGSLAQRRFLAVLLASFAGLGLLLAALGIYGVVNYSVSQRTREIGIRIAVGAAGRDILRREMAAVMARVAAGLAAGTLAALALRSVVASLLYQVSATDPATFAAVAALLALVALAACYVPARRASRVDPILALRQE